MVEGLDAGAVHAAVTLSAKYREKTDEEHKRAWGQFFTSPRIAQFMAGLLGAPRGREIRILDPGAGTGILGLAAAASLLARFEGSVHLTAVEKEPGAALALRASLEHARGVWGHRFSFDVIEDDFLDLDRPQLGKPGLSRFHYAIGNPPYFKMSPSDVRGGDAPNAYARFMDVALRMLDEGGELCFIVPRSFASGYYFRRFRRQLHASARLDHVHVFDSRRDAFREDRVLQENIIVLYRKTRARSDDIVVTASHGEIDIDSHVTTRVARTRVVSDADRDAIISLPTNERDLAVMELVQRWPSTLAHLGLDVSTGPVVPFRAEEFLRGNPEIGTVPMLWLQHVQRGVVTWPLGPSFRKPEHILGSAGAKLLVPNKTYVLLRRFSPKEDERRIIAAPFLPGALDASWLGLENHVNFIHRPKGTMAPAESIGLAALLNSSLIDTYFRISSGNTQVSATELRVLPLPSATVLTTIAALIARGHEIDHAVGEVLGEA